ncbi:hypothetical protein GCM10027447_39020 [Glycomyces halotolerans]
MDPPGPFRGADGRIRVADHDIGVPVTVEVSHRAARASLRLGGHRTGYETTGSDKSENSNAGGTAARPSRAGRQGVTEHKGPFQLTTRARLDQWGLSNRE